MKKITYPVVKLHGSWAYEANGIYSERFETREAARKAARLAAAEHAPAYEIAPRTSENKEGQWHDDTG